MPSAYGTESSDKDHACYGLVASVRSQSTVYPLPWRPTLPVQDMGHIWKEVLLVTWTPYANRIFTLVG